MKALKLSRQENENLKKQLPLVLMKIILGMYVLLCLVIAGLNYGVAPGAKPEVQLFISNLWHFYENEFKTMMIIVCSVLSMMLIKKNERKRMRRMNYTGFIITALIVHIIGPVVTGTKELYFFSMPLPWSSNVIQVFEPGTAFHNSFTEHWGTAGLSVILAFIIFYNIFIFIGTILFGRRLQCSHICMFNGFASEIFSEAFPLIGRKKKKKGKGLRIFFGILRVVILVASIFFTIAAILSITGIIDLKGNRLLYQIETYKYLSVELLMAMFFWVIYTGRGYCNYCPVGTILAFIGRASGQRINTDLSKCIGCGKCDKACPMSINISGKAKDGLPVISLDCVGCGHCVDVCPTETLGYSTNFLNKLKTLRATKL